MAPRALTAVLCGLLLAGCVSVDPTTTSAIRAPGASVTGYRDYNVARTSAPYDKVQAAHAAIEAGQVHLTIMAQDDVDRVCGTNAWGCTATGSLASIGHCTVIMSDEIDDVRILAYLVADHEVAHCAGWGGGSRHPTGVTPTDQQLAWIDANADRIVALMTRPIAAPTGPGMTAAQIAHYAAAFCASLPERRRPEACT